MSCVSCRFNSYQNQKIKALTYTDDYSTDFFAGHAAPLVALIFEWSSMTSMKSMLPKILLIHALSGCQTAPSIPAPITKTTVHCTVRLPKKNNAALSDLEIEARFSSEPQSKVMLVLSRKNQTFPEVLSSRISSDGIIVFKANATQDFGIDVHEIQRMSPTKMGAERDEIVSISPMNSDQAKQKTVPCVFFVSSDTEKADTAACNAQGTPAEGWYYDGRIIKLSATCNKEMLSCSEGKNSGWFLQKKKQVVLAKLEKCGWTQELPTCRSGSLATGWHIGDRLISRDDDCSYKHIECGKQTTKKEGWYVFEHTKPELFLSENCKPNRETTYLDH